MPRPTPTNDQSRSPSPSAPEVDAEKIDYVGALENHLEKQEQCRDYCRYLPLTVNDVSCSALVDSGNVYRTVISETFAKLLRIDPRDLVPLVHDSVQTADKDGKLQVLGEVPRDLRFTVYPVGHEADQGVTFRLRPAVVRGLGMMVNLSGPFLKAAHIDQLHSQDALRLKDGSMVQLLPWESSQIEPELAVTSVVVEQRTRLPARSVSYVPSVAGSAVAGKDGVIVGNPRLVDRHGVLPWRSAAVRAGPDGKLLVGVLNPSDRAVYLKRGTTCGSYRPACRPEDAAVYPWRTPLCVAHLSEGVVHKPTVREKLDRIIEKMRRKARSTKDEKLPEKPPTPTTREEKLAWLRERFELRKSKFLQEDAKIRQKAEELLLSYWDIFSIHGEFGSTNLVEHHINTGDHPPIKCKNRPINPYLEDDLRRQMEDLLERGVVEPSQSPWSFPLVAAPKKNSTLRWCVDYRRLNKCTDPDSFPLPSIEDNLARLSGSQVFSTLDGAGAFHVVPVAKRHKEKTAFSTPWGLYQYRKMPFGLCNGPATYSRLVQIMLQGIPTSMALAYLDDIIVHSPTVAQHIDYLEIIFDAHRQAGLKLQPAKCQLFRDIVDYVGLLVSGKGIRTQPGYVKDVKDWPFPLTKGDVRTFLGKMGYYRRFIKGFSAIAGPLTDLTKKDAAVSDRAIIPETPLARSAFEDLKARLTQAPILAYPRFGKDDPPFILDTDWSQEANAIGGVLSQVQDGKERVIMYGGKKMSAAQRNYTSFKGELAALLHFTKVWEYYLVGRPFIVRTDHAPLVHLWTMKTPDRHVLRLLATLADLRFTVQYRPGPKHANADALSRAPHLRDQPDAMEDVGVDTEEDERRLLGAIGSDIDRHAAYDSAVSSVPSPFHPDGRFSREAIRLAQQMDDDLSPVMEHLKRHTSPDNLELQAWSPESRMLWGNRQLLEVSKDGVLRYQRPKSDEFARKRLVVLPRVLWTPLVQRLHQLGGHCGAEVTTQRVLRGFYIPRTLAEVQDILRRCKQCRLKKSRPAKQRGLLRSVVEGYPFQRLAVDFVGPLSKAGPFRYIFTCRDGFSKWLEAFPCAEPTAAVAVDKLVNEVFRRYGIPETIHSDRGTHFTARLFREVAAQLGISLTTTPSYHAQSNPVERVHRDLGNMLRALQNDNGLSWAENLPAAVMAVNTNRHAGTLYSPFQLLFGRDPPIPLTVFYDDPKKTRRALTEYARDLQRTLHSAFRFTRQHLKAAVERRRRNYKGKYPSYVVGQRVYLCSPSVRVEGKYKSGLDWTGPWTITKLFSPLTVEVTAPAEWQLRRPRQVVSVDRLVEFPPEDTESRPQHELPDWNLAGDEAVERPPAGPVSRPQPMAGQQGAGANGEQRRGKPGGDGEDSSDDDDDDTPARPPGAAAAGPSPAPSRQTPSSHSPSGSGRTSPRSSHSSRSPPVRGWMPEQGNWYADEMRQRHEMDLLGAADRLGRESMAWDPQCDLEGDWDRDGLESYPLFPASQEDRGGARVESDDAQESGGHDLRSASERKSTRRDDFVYDWSD